MTDPPEKAGTTAAAVPAWHAVPPGELLAALRTAPDGLTSEEATARLGRCGPNRLRLSKPVSAWQILLAQFRSVVVLLLLAAMVVAWLIGDAVEAAAVLGVLLINTAIGFVTELRARTAMAALLRLEVPEATVVRDGVERVVESASLVPGDIITVDAGNAVPADARLLTATELRTSEAALTGESLPVAKDAGAMLAADTPLAERVNALYMATAVVDGAGRAVVTATAMATEVGRIGGLVGQIREQRTPLEERLDALGRRLVAATLGVGLIVIAAGWLRGQPLALMIETGIALAIAAVPEGLPAVSTIALAIGVARMARRNALVRRLPAVESLGSATTVCTDKTGTLTAGEMTVTTIRAGGREYDITGSGYEPAGEFRSGGRTMNPLEQRPLELALRISTLTNRAALEHDDGGWRAHGDPTEAALLVAAQKAGLDRTALLAESPETGSLPFSSRRMLMATYHGDVAYVKGAPARVIEASSQMLTDDGPVELDADRRAALIESNDTLAARGLRVLALATGAVPPAGEGLCDLTLVGLVGMSDPPAAGVRETIDGFRTAGIRTIMITGDQRLTAASVGRALGILGTDDDVVDGRELTRLSGDALADRLRHASALSRVSPEDKLRIVEALQRRGDIVAMLGDGVNDAAALKKADVGVAMGMRGTDVAKEAADVVLQDDRFLTIGAAVEEGRVIFDNIRKFVFYLFSCNVAEVLVILTATVLGLPQPLLPLQILWLNLITDTFPALSLAAEPAEPDVLTRPPRDPQAAILAAPFVRSILFYGVLITAVTLGAFAWSLSGPDADPARSVTIAFMTLALAQTFHLGNARGGGPVLSWRRVIGNPWALGAAAFTVAIQFAAVYVAPLAELLQLVPLRADDWLIVLPLAALPAVLGQLVAVVRGGRV